MTRPLAIDLFCGLGGWTEGLLEEGYRVVGFDIEQHAYGSQRYPAQLVLQDVLTIHGRQFKDADLIVASPPCQAYSYMAMPWSKAKQIQREYEDGTRDVAQLTALFDACFRIQREACEAAGRHIPLVVENVRGAQRWVGRSRWNFGSFHLWGDVPALMPITMAATKVPGFRFDGSGKSFQTASVEGVKVGDYGGNGKFPPGGLAQGAIDRGVKVPTMGAGWYPPGHPKHRPGLAFNGHAERGVKFSQSGAAWFDGTPRDKMLGEKGPAAHGSKSPARKAASALIAKIPITLSRHIARAWHPERAA